MLDRYATSQLQMFWDSCFGYFFHLPPIKIQNQLNILLSGHEKELCLKLNGCTLQFGIGEFALITGLK